MQLHELKPNIEKKNRKRVGRGGKRGTYSGKGQKGQRARSPIKPDFRGGNAPIWKLFPKQRGATKKTKIKHRYFSTRQVKPASFNVDKINDLFKDGDKVNAQAFFEKGLVDSKKEKIKILGGGALKKKLVFENILFSESARKKVIDSGSTIQ